MPCESVWLRIGDGGENGRVEHVEVHADVDLVGERFNDEVVPVLENACERPVADFMGKEHFHAPFLNELRFLPVLGADSDLCEPLGIEELADAGHDRGMAVGVALPGFAEP